MKIFNLTEGWSDKVNFVDENNVLLGYDLSQCCCESAGWLITDNPLSNMDEHNDYEKVSELPGWNFDPTYFAQRDNSSKYDCGGIVTFRIVNGDEQKFVHIYNSHNGYYGHGFYFNAPNNPHEGTI